MANTLKNQDNQQGIIYGIKKFLYIYALVVIAIVATFWLRDWIIIFSNNGVVIIPEGTAAEKIGDFIVYHSVVRPGEFLIEASPITINEGYRLSNFAWGTIIAFVIILIKSFKVAMQPKEQPIEAINTERRKRGS